VVEVNNLHEGLDLGSLLKLSLAHGLDNLSGVAVNASNCDCTCK
jgi:hypothetical protein